MNVTRATRAVAIASLIGAACFPVAAAPPQVRAAPKPVMANPNAPQRDVQPAPEQKYTALKFRVSTGDDDLRTDSTAWVMLTFPDHTTQKCVLRAVEEDTWSNGSTHQDDIPQCVLPSAMTYDQLKASKMVLYYGSQIPAGVMGGAGDFLHTTDNWNVNEVRIEALNSTQFTQRCLMDATGNPLVRMKDSLRSFDLSATPTVC